MSFSICLDSSLDLSERVLVLCVSSIGDTNELSSEKLTDLKCSLCSTNPRHVKPNFEVGSRGSKQGKSLSTSPSSSVMYKPYCVTGRRLCVPWCEL